MALNKKSGLVIALIIIVAALAYVVGFMGSKPSGDAPEIQSDLTVENPEEQDHKHDLNGNHVDPVSPNQSSVLDDLRTPTPLTVNPVLGVRAIGDPNAPVKVTEIFSLTCSHCAVFHNDIYPLVKENFVDTGKVYYVYQEFPLNAPALHASMIARCLPEARYSGFIDILFKTQDKWIGASDYKEVLRQNAKLAGMSDEEFDACMDNTELQQAFASVIQEASEKWEIRATPSIIINDGEKVIKGAQKYPAMESALNQFLTRASTTAEQGDNIKTDNAEEEVNNTKNANTAE